MSDDKQEKIYDQIAEEVFTLPNTAAGCNILDIHVVEQKDTAFDMDNKDLMVIIRKDDTGILNRKWIPLRKGELTALDSRHSTI